ncbi:MAG TPA: cupin domain-containing protein [Solirubrobacteraceae bacterium]|jgi:quercetin dioxygenase-like cupin family protein|nr:cupin domain-containing protein [Solirubrobacteraceae bacterium]
MPEPAPRRIVTGHDGAGRSVITADGAAPASRSISDGAVFHEMWLTDASPAAVTADQREPTAVGQPLGPPASGTRVRIVDMPPGVCSPMHRTESIDYGVVLEGTVTLVLDGGESVEIGQGELVVQRGTSHAWENRSEAAARLLFVLVAGSFDDELTALLPADAVTHNVD